MILTQAIPYDDFEGRIGMHRYVVLIAYSRWCAGCMPFAPQKEQVGPGLERLNQQFPTATFATIDCDQNLWIVDKLKIDMIPQFIFYEKGVEVGRYAGNNEAILGRTISDLVSGKLSPQAAKA